MSFMQDSKEVVSLDKVGVCFSLDFYLEGTLRSKFVQAVSSPLTLLGKNGTPLWALKDISFSVKNGDRVGILGRNGAGKTTLCRLISSMIKETTGIKKINGEVRGIFNTTIGVIPELTGRENLELVSVFVYPTISKSERRALVEEVIDFAELGPQIDTSFQHYSRGMQARLFLSLVSARPADIIILDEVYDGADIFFQKRVAKRFNDLINLTGASLFVSHNPEQIRAACNRVVVLDYGQIIYDGSVEKGIDHYQRINNAINSRN